MKKLSVSGLLGLVLLLASPNLAFALNCADPGATASTTLCNPITFYNGTTGSFAFQVVATAATFFTLIAVIYVVYSGFLMVISQGDAEALTKAKNALLWTVLGLILGMFAFVLVSATGTFIGATAPDVNSYSQNNLALNPLAAKSFGELLYTLLRNFLSVIGIITILMIVLGGFRYITSAGNEEQAESGKKTVQWAAIGLIVALFGYVIIRATLTFFEVKKI